MKSLQKLFLGSFILMLVSIAAYSQQHSTKPLSKYHWKYTTIAHQLLRQEEDVSMLPEKEKGAFYDPEYKKIDDLIDSVTNRINPLIKNKRIDEKINALKILATIDSAIVENNFIICITTDRLSDALAPTKPEELKCSPFLTDYRKKHIFETQQADYFPIDCDLGAFLYLSVGEVNNLPLKLVEVPDHFFVRWRFNTGDYINWDNNSAQTFSDDEYRKGLSPTSATAFNKIEEMNAHYLTDMTINEINGYYTSIIAQLLSTRKKYTESVLLYEKSIKARPYAAKAYNNISWMIVTTKELQGAGNYLHAFQYSSIADSLAPGDKNYKDTYACACAAVGDFAKAIMIETQAFNDTQKIEAFKKRQTCLDLLKLK